MAEKMKKTSWNILPIELKSMAMHDAPDISSLFNLITADPSVTSELRYSFSTILPSVLARSMPKELQLLVGTLLTIREAGKVSNSEVEVLLQPSLIFDKKKQRIRLRTNIKHPVAALRTILQIQKAVDHFTLVFARALCQPPTTCPQTQQLENPVLSATESHRIRRSLWRFQICCELSSSWMPSGELDLAQSGADDRIPRLMMYLKQFNPWEVEELNCIYDFLENMLQRDPRDPRLDYLGNTVNPYALPAPRFGAAAPGQAAPGVKAKILSQGLPFLRTYLRQTHPRTRVSREQTLYFPSDEFVLPALYELKNGHRFSQISEIVISSNTCPWTDNHGAHLANAGWNYFSAEHPQDISSFAYLRQFGFCIWDSNRLVSWDVLNRRYGSALNKKLMEVWNPWVSRRSTVYSGLFELEASYLPDLW